jgi:uncharacterized membrane protein YccC
MKAAIVSVPLRDWLVRKLNWLDDEALVAITFAIKTFVAGLLALYVAFWLGLDEPRWALLTVYSVSQPESGLVLAKGFYRGLGTTAGLLFSTLLVLMFAQHEELFLPLLALWTGVCNFAARAARNFMTYGFLLAGYTAAIIGIPAAVDPANAYTLIVARGTEVGIGVVFAALVSRLLFPQDLVKKLLALIQNVIIQTRQFGSVVPELATENARVVELRMQLIQDLTSIESMRASTYFESVEARRLNEPVRQVGVASLTVCAVAEGAASRRASPRQSSIVGHSAIVRLLSKSSDSPGGNASVTRALVSISDQSDMFDAQSKLDKAKGALEEKSPEVHQSSSLETWSEPIPAILTGVRTTLAVAITSATWIITAWPSGPVAIIVSATVCSLLAALEQPAVISLALAVTILVATAPVFVTVFYLLPLASDFASMALALAPLLLICGFILAQPKIGPVGVLTVVYFTVGSNIDNVMNYSTINFFNTSLAILFGIGVALVLFATFFPETPALAVRNLQAQLSYRISRFPAMRESIFSSFAYGLCDQSASALTQVRNDSSATQRCYAMTMAALSIAYAIESLKKVLSADLPLRIKIEIETLLGRVSLTFSNPTVAGFVKQAWEARRMRMHILREARAAKRTHLVVDLGRALAGCEKLRAGLLKSRVLFDEVHRVG